MQQAAQRALHLTKLWLRRRSRWGYVDAVSENCVRGWAYAPGTEFECTSVILLVDGREAGQCLAGSYREDLHEAGIGDGCHGFELPIPSEFYDGRPHEVVVVTAPERKRLRGSPLQVLLPKLSTIPLLEAPSGAALPPNLQREFLTASSVDAATVAAWGKRSDQVLIVGSAPTINEHVDQITSFRGEIWALNDATFWLSSKDIVPDRVFITDTRFIKKAKRELAQANIPFLVTIDAVDLSELDGKPDAIWTLRSLGRDGFSLRFGEVYHGCSVFFTALQSAVTMRYVEIYSCGVMFPPPSSYTRVNGSKTLPEYVHHVQIKNARTALSIIRGSGHISFTPLESASNLNFL